MTHMQVGLEISGALSTQITILATELAVLALFPAVRQLIGEIRESSRFAGFSAGQSFNFVVYVNVVALAVTILGTVISLLGMVGWLGRIADEAVLYGLVASVLAFVGLAIVLGFVVSRQFVRN